MDKILTFNTLAFCIVAVLAMGTHSVKKWVRGELKGNPVDWYLENPRASVMALGTAITGTLAAILGGQVFDLNSGAHILAVWGIGYAADSAVNKQ